VQTSKLILGMNDRANNMFNTLNN